MGGLRYESLADMPQGIRKQVTAKLLREPRSVAGKSKYHNQKQDVDGIVFDSKKEAARFQQLMSWAKEGAIYDLRMQEEFTLREGFTTTAGERICAIRYRADFTYKVNEEWFVGLPDNFVFDDDDLKYWRRWAWAGKASKKIIEDVKSRGTKTEKYRMKYKMMADLGFTIREVN